MRYVGPSDLRRLPIQYLVHFSSSALGGHDTTLGHYETLAQVLEEVLKSVREEADELRAMQRRQQNSILPAVNTPVEILQRILEESCFQDAAFLQHLGLGAHMVFIDMLQKLRRSRHIVPSVCSRWRAIVLNDGALWAQVAIEYLRTMTPPHEQFTTETLRWGRRALSIQLAMDYCYEDALAHIIEAHRLAFYRQTTRLDVWGNCTPGSPIFEMCRFPHLGALQIRLILQQYGNAVLATPTIDLTLSQDLREVLIDITDDREGQLQAVSIRAPQNCAITHLTLWSPLEYDSARAIDTDACVALINSCRYLEKLDWSTAEPHRHGFSLDIESQEYLTELSIGGDIPFSLLPDMHYPKLIKLRIHDCSEYDETVQFDLTKAVIHRLLSSLSKFPKLRHLDQRLCMHTSRVIPFLHAHPDLEELVLWCDLDEAWVEGLTAKSSASAFKLPNLARVWTNRRLHESREPSPVEELLRRRALHQNSSKPFKLYLHPDFPGPNASQLGVRFGDNVTVEDGAHANDTWYRYNDADDWDL